ncbi:hypothetical protein SAMN05421740_1191 [Parapedobacter koreensis]|uniref:Uncharacterized protein n=1 Tax=Parapedobacter koreensis TaxID=332977 RepID=A0A1H7UN66_9SPHI|nr:hypothetical protein SAMN05421740_1191 [Parapedobacter koreensis]
MTANNFKVWEQAENLSTQMYFVELKDSFGKLSIFLKDINAPENTLEIRFSGILGYRVFQEGARLRLLNQDSTFGLINYDTPYLLDNFCTKLRYNHDTFLIC